MRKFGGPGGEAAFVAALGFEDTSPSPVARSEYGLADVPEAANVVRLARRDGLEVVLIELKAEPVARVIARIARRVRAADALRRHLLILARPRGRSIAVASIGLDDTVRDLVLDRQRPQSSDIDTLAEMVAAAGEGGTALALRYARALDRSRVTERFFADVRVQRARISNSWRGLSARLRAERDQMALLLLCRLMFLYFLQRRGHLAGDAAYLPDLLERWHRSESRAATFYRSVLVPLFFGALNTRPEARGAAARALGGLPYLNGGLFECSAVERRYPDLDLPDGIVSGLFSDLLERYRFAVRDASDGMVAGTHESGIDPEMLGRVFEALMSEDRRGDTGTFFTPAATVDGLVTETIAEHVSSRIGIAVAEARSIVTARGGVMAGSIAGSAVGTLRDLRIVDPACGSGAFLLGALSRVSSALASLGECDEAGIRRELVANALHGVDVQSDAALLCALRLWLALTLPAGNGAIEPLPNLDRRIRQGDALLDPLDLAMPCVGLAPLDCAAAVDASVRAAVRALAPAARAYTSAEPQHRPVLQRELAEGEAALARAWIAAIDGRLAYEQRKLEAVRGERDLFDQPTAASRSAGVALERVQVRRAEMQSIRTSLDDTRALPFFSFSVHFAEAAMNGFDVVLSNPPWVRVHRWPPALARLVRTRYAVCRDSGWALGARLAGAPSAATSQVDLAMLFLERALALLAPSGTLGMLLPAKLLRSLYGGSARWLLSSEARVRSIEDHGLDQRSVFRADAFTVAIVATKKRPAHEIAASAESASSVRVRLIRRSAPALEFDVPLAELPLFPGDERAPWLLAPERVRAALRRMQAAGSPIGLSSDMRVRRGVFTGANDALLIRDARARLGELASVRAEGWFPGGANRATDRVQRSKYEAVIEARTMRPVLRGSDIDAWGFALERWIVWTHDERGIARQPPVRLARYLDRHREKLDRRTGVRRNQPPGAVFRVTRAALGHKVVWHDLARTLEAVAVPATLRNAMGFEAEIVPLNTVYFIATADRNESLLLSAYLNSLPVRVFARTIAERAKDARFRFFAWTVGALPLPARWRQSPAATALTSIAHRAHAARCLSPPEQAELDRIVASLFGLGDEDVAALADFDRWLSG